MQCSKCLSAAKSNPSKLGRKQAGQCKCRLLDVELDTISQVQSQTLDSRLERQGLDMVDMAGSTYKLQMHHQVRD